MSRVADVHPVPSRLATQVAFSTFHQAAPFTRELLQGYERARVVTYSASLNTVRWLIGQVGSLAAYQHLLLEELGQDAQAQGEGAPLFLALREGRLRVYALQEAVSHAKLYLLEKGDQTRVITGSANLSDRALFDPQAAGAAQHEHLTVYDNQPLAWDHYEAEYAALRAQAELLQWPAGSATVAPEDLPLFQAIRQSPLVVQVPIEVPATARDLRLEELRRQYAPALREAVSRVRGRTHLGAEGLPTVARVWQDREVQGAGQRVLRLDRQGEALVGSTGFRVAACLHPPGLEDDVRLLTEFFGGYTEFSGEGSVDLMQGDYFAFLSWLYISPFLSDLLVEGLRTDHSPQQFPLYAVLMGKSSSGKTTAIRVFLRSMIGSYALERPGQELGKRSLRALQTESGRLPVYFNDVERDKLRQIASDLKNTAELHTGEAVLAPMVFSLNGGEQGLEDELRKTHPCVAGHARSRSHPRLARAALRAPQRSDPDSETDRHLHIRGLPRPTPARA